MATTQDGDPRCKWCHRKLTSPASIARGIGSTCWGKLYSSVARNRAHSRRKKAKAKAWKETMYQEGLTQLVFQFS